MEKLFDQVAPLFIYFKADLQYKKEAQKAFRLLKKQLKGNPDSLPIDLQIEISEAKDLGDLERQFYRGRIWSLYNELFEEIVQSIIPDALPTYDYWGA